MSVAGDAPYHEFHRLHHLRYVKHLEDKGYYDIFFFDLDGNAVYTVFKETDFGTNFGVRANLDEKQAEWQDSVLGDAFRMAMRQPTVVTLTPWMPYGPSNGALASFLATGVHSEGGDLMGIYATQMPAQAMSIDNIEPACTLAAITQRLDGAINFAGLGRPLPQNLEVQIPCFKGETARSFLAIVDKHLKEGYDGDSSVAVTDPYHEIKGHAADGTCVIAYTVKYLLDQGFNIDQIRKRDQTIYDTFLAYMRTELEFRGASGNVKFSGNDKPAYLAVQQIRAGVQQVVGTCSHTGEIVLNLNGGPENSTWKGIPPVPPEPPAFPVVEFACAVAAVCAVACAVAVVGITNTLFQ